MYTVPLRRTSLQTCVYNGHKTLVTKPHIGSILYRLERKAGKLCEFVVTSVTHKSSGNNKDIIDRAVLQTVLGTGNTQVRYLQNSELILHLTNRGSWWTRSLEKDYLFSWDFPPSEDVTVLNDCTRRRSS